MTCGIYRMEYGSKSFYVGSSKDIERRMRSHLSLLRRNVHPNQRMQYSWAKHGDPIVAVVVECSEGELLTLEQQLIDASFNDPRCLNLAPVAGRTTGIKLSEETRQKMSSSKRGMTYGPPSEETRRKIGDANRGRVWDESRREGWGDALKARANHSDLMAALSAGNIGRSPSAETRRKISVTNTGKTRSADHCAALSLSRMGRPGHQGEAMWSSKLTDDQVLAIRSRASAGERHADIAAAFSISRSNVGMIAAGKTWTHLLPTSHSSQQPSNKEQS